MFKSVKMRIYLALIILLLIAIPVIFILAIRMPTTSAAVPAASGKPMIRTEVQTVEKVVEVKKQITADIIQDGLNDMGLLITQEYYFTEVADYSSTKTLWKIQLPGSESSFVITYDGTVDAGIDFSRIRVEKDEGIGVITVHVPKSEIHKVTIDHNSFELHSEKQSILNPISVADYNSSLVEMENKARQKAIDRGILTKADENAQVVISNFISGLMDGTEYRLNYVTD